MVVITAVIYDYCEWMSNWNDHYIPTHVVLVFTREVLLFCSLPVCLMCWLTIFWRWTMFGWASTNITVSKYQVPDGFAAQTLDMGLHNVSCGLYSASEVTPLHTFWTHDFIDPLYWSFLYYVGSNFIATEVHIKLTNKSNCAHKCWILLYVLTQLEVNEANCMSFQGVLPFCLVLQRWVFCFVPCLLFIIVYW